VAVRERFASLIGAIDRKTPVPSRSNIDVSSVMREHGKEKNDRKRDSDQPKQRAFSERHGDLH
jgi:hypothetical protein